MDKLESFHANLASTCLNPHQNRLVPRNMFKIRKATKIRNLYNQVSHLAQDTTLESDKNTIKHHKQEVSPFPAGVHNAALNKRDQPVIISFLVAVPMRCFFCGVFFLCYLCFSLPYCLVCFLQPCGHLLGEGWPLGSLFLCVFVIFPCGVLGQVYYLIVF